MRPINAKEYSDRLIWMIKYGTYQGVEDALLDVLYKLTEMPTLTLDDLRPKGQWVEGYPVTCSICGHSAETLYEDCNIYRAIRTPYCSYCGADMRGGGEDV